MPLAKALIWQHNRAGMIGSAIVAVRESHPRARALLMQRKLDRGGSRGAMSQIAGLVCPATGGGARRPPPKAAAVMQPRHTRQATWYELRAHGGADQRATRAGTGVGADAMACQPSLEREFRARVAGKNPLASALMPLRHVP